MLWLFFVHLFKRLSNMYVLTKIRDDEEDGKVSVLDNSTDKRASDSAKDIAGLCAGQIFIYFLNGTLFICSHEI